MSTLKRKQIYLDIDSDRALKQLSYLTNTSEAEHIRRAVKDYIANQRRCGSEDDPLLEIIGLCDNPEGPKDTSIHHDKYLYGKGD